MSENRRGDFFWLTRDSG